MKRHEGIVKLSRDHHQGLLFCWKIRQGIKLNIPVERMIPYVPYFWEHHLLQHFSEEEEILFVGINDDLIKKALLDHHEIKELMQPGATITTVEKLNEIADKVDQHIRFEERTLFPHLEKVLTEEVLESIGNKLSLQHQNHAKDEYKDEFWI